MLSLDHDQGDRYGGQRHCRHRSQCELSTVESDMQFRVAMHAGDVDLSVVERELHAVDPAAVVDFDGAGDQLRVSTFMSVFDLIAVADRAGYPVTRDQVVPMKSECCGGCGG